MSEISLPSVSANEAEPSPTVIDSFGAVASQISELW
jgi:hypothetical protein